MPERGETENISKPPHSPSREKQSARFKWVGAMFAERSYNLRVMFLIIILCYLPRFLRIIAA